MAIHVPTCLVLLLCLAPLPSAVHGQTDLGLDPATPDVEAVLLDIAPSAQPGITAPAIEEILLDIALSPQPGVPYTFDGYDFIDIMLEESTDDTVENAVRPMHAHYLPARTDMSAVLHVQ